MLMPGTGNIKTAKKKMQDVYFSNIDEFLAFLPEVTNRNEYLPKKGSRDNNKCNPGIPTSMRIYRNLEIKLPRCCIPGKGITTVFNEIFPR